MHSAFKLPIHAARSEAGGCSCVVDSLEIVAHDLLGST